jgi:hypothetical protein
MMQREPEGRIAENIVSFCRTLRCAGLPVGTGQVIDALTAATIVGVQRREDFCQALRAVLVKDPGQFRLFAQAFQVYFRNPRLLERMMSMLLPSRPVDPEEAGKALRRLLESLSAPVPEGVDDVTVEIDRSATWSYREVLRQKDFEQMTLAEQREARELLREEILLFGKIATRRFRSSAYGHRYDLRRSMQKMMRNNGQLIELARKRRTERTPVLVLICDISGSMSRYSRMFLHFAHTLGATNHTVHSFVFGTRLTNISRRLRDRDVDHAMTQISADVRDWDGGTRIGESLARFNKDWSRRVLAQNAVVVLLSDGLERESEADLEFEIQRLGRSCRRLIWLNPVLRFAGFEPKAAGIRKMLPHVDYFLPAHNVASLAELGAVLLQGAGSGQNNRTEAGIAT